MKTKITESLIPKIRPEDKPYEIVDTILPAFLLRVQPSGVMTYYAVYKSAEGKRTRSRIGGTELSVAQARDKAREVLAGVTLGDDPQAAKKKARAHTFKTFLEEEYIPWLKQNRKTGAYMGEALLAAFPSFHDLKLDAITPWIIEKWRKEAKESNKDDVKDSTRKNSTINRLLAYLKAAMTRAAEWGFTDALSLRSVKKQREDSRVVRYLSDDERKSLMDTLDAREERIRAERDSYNLWARQRGYPERMNLRTVAFADYLRPMIVVSLNTGMRQGELFTLQWQDVDFDVRTITIQSENAKSGKARHIPMNDIVFDALTGWHRQTTGAGLVFVSPQTGKQFDNANRAWREVLKAAEITGFRWHDMRHDFASKLVMSGADLYVVKELLGHSSIQMTERYAHLTPSAKAAAVKLLDVPANVVPLHKEANGAS